MGASTQPVAFAVRRPDWREQLVATQAAQRSEPFSWGRHDCALAACDAVAAMTGVDPARSLRGYSDARGAAKALRDAGFANLEQAAGALFPRHAIFEVSIEWARAGDVLLYREEPRPSLGVVMVGGADAQFPGVDGAAFRPVYECHRAWRVA